MGKKTNSENNELRVDGAIWANEVQVIDDDNVNCGVMKIRDAKELASSRELNLVEVSAKSSPPVCRILDYGKYRYDQKRAERKRKKNQQVTVLKEMKFRPRISDHDFDFKVRKIKQFLENGHHVKCTVMFRGREMEHTDLGEILLERVIESVDCVTIEQPIKLEGRDMTVRFVTKTN